jgi:hypothetical protein
MLSSSSSKERWTVLDSRCPSNKIALSRCRYRQMAVLLLPHCAPSFSGFEQYTILIGGYCSRLRDRHYLALAFNPCSTKRRMALEHERSPLATLPGARGAGGSVYGQGFRHNYVQRKCKQRGNVNFASAQTRTTQGANSE